MTRSGPKTLHPRSYISSWRVACKFHIILSLFCNDLISYIEQIEGQMNEHIATTALYYLDSENITDSNLSFRIETSAYMKDYYKIWHDCYHSIEQIYGTSLGNGSSPCLQNYCSVEVIHGRLLAFYNILCVPYDVGKEA